VGSNRRYAEAVDSRMDARILERAMAEHPPASLSDTELELDVELLVRPDRAVPCRAWVRYGTTPVNVVAEAVAWTPRAVAIRWRAPSGDTHRAWVWSSAVRHAR
jgi:hypothetical protein